MSTDKTPLPVTLPFPSRTQIIVEKTTLTDIPYWEWIVAGIVIASIIIVAVIISVIVVMCKKKESQVYAEEDNPSDGNDAGNAVVLSVYRLSE